MLIFLFMVPGVAEDGELSWGVCRNTLPLGAGVEGEAGAPHCLLLGAALCGGARNSSGR